MHEDLPASDNSLLYPGLDAEEFLCHIAKRFEKILLSVGNQKTNSILLDPAVAEHVAEKCSKIWSYFVWEAPLEPWSQFVWEWQKSSIDKSPNVARKPSDYCNSVSD